MRRGNFVKRAAAMVMAAVLAAGSAVQPDWYISAKGEETEYILAETEGTAKESGETASEKAESRSEEILIQETDEAENSTAQQMQETEKTPEALPQIEIEDVSPVPPEAVPDADMTIDVPEEPVTGTVTPAGEEMEGGMPPGTQTETAGEIQIETEGGIQTETETGELVIVETEQIKETGMAAETEEVSDAEQDFVSDIADLEILPETGADIPAENVPAEISEEPAAEGMCALLYENGDLVFQKGETPASDKGSVKKSWTGLDSLAPADEYSWPWYADRKLIRTVSFRDAYRPPTARGMFFDCSEMVSFDGKNLDTSSVTTMKNMFSGCSSLAEFEGSSWNTSAVTDMNSMFLNCSALAQIDIRGWDMSRVTAMTNTFRNAPLRRITLGPLCRLLPDALPYTVQTRDPSTGKTYSQTVSWIRGSTGETYTSKELCTGYSGAAMADTYYWKITVSFDGNGGTAVPSSVGTYEGEVLKNLPFAKRKGYLFDGWYTERSGGSRLGPGDPIAQETYYAHWNVSHYTLILRACSEKEEETQAELAYDELYTLPGDLFENGDLKLKSWNTSRDGAGRSFSPGEEVWMLTDEDGGQVILYAQWEDGSGKTKVIFNTQGGEPMDPLPVEPGASYGNVVRNLIPLFEGHTFIAWHVGSPDGPQVKSGDCMGQEDITLFAEWKRNPVITFDMNGEGSETSQKQTAYGGKAGPLPRYFPEDGRVLTGWFTEASGGTEVKPDQAVYEDVTFYAHWGWRPVFDANGGIITKLPEYPVQESEKYQIGALPEVRRDGYTLKGWFLDDGTKAEEGQTLDLSKGAVLTADWEERKTVELTLDPSPWDSAFSAGEAKTFQIYQGQPVGVLPAPKYKPSDGRIFLGWFDQEKRQWTEDMVITEDTVLHAAWSGPAVQVTFDAGEKAEPSRSTLKIPAGTTVNVLPGARKQDYILEGWYTGKDGAGEKLTRETIIEKETTYYARWIPFSLNTADQTSVYTYGAEWGNASNENVDASGDSMVVHPTDNRKQTAMLHIRFEMNLDIGEVTLPEGTVQIRIPKYVWKDWDNKDTGTNNLSDNIPKYPDIRSGMFFSYKEEEDCYLLVNNQPLSGGTGLDAVISYTVSPWDVPGGAMDADGRYLDGYPYYKDKVEVSFSVDEDKDGEAETSVSKELSLEMHTHIRTEPVKKFSAFYYNWQSSWGEKPADADDYFYTCWYLDVDFYNHVNQPGTYEWTEDGQIHDGTVVVLKNPVGAVDNAGHRNTVILRHPISLLRDAPAEGLPLHNEAVLKITWKSGYEMFCKVQADTRVYRDDQYPPGEFDKKRHGYRSGEHPDNKLIVGGQEILVKDEKDVSMDWELEYDGGTQEHPVWDEKTGTYTAKERTIRIRDGLSKDMLYSSGRAQAKYIWEPDTGNIELSDNDYSFVSLELDVWEYDAECRDGLWTDPVLNTDTESIKSFDIYIRRRGSDRLVFWTSVPGTGLKLDESYPDRTIQFPEGTVGFELRHDTSFYQTDIRLRLLAALHPTQRVNGLVTSDMEAGATSLIKNKAHCDVWEKEDGENSPYFSATNYTGPDDAANKAIWELNMSETTQYAWKHTGDKDDIVIDVTRGTQDIPIYIGGWNYNSSGKRKTQMKSGILYDLLPKGTTVDTSTLFGFPIRSNWNAPSHLRKRAPDYDSYSQYSSKLSKSRYNVRFTENWKGSGRTMMVITFSLPDDPETTGAEFFYLLHNTYENILLNGTTVENDLAFVNTSEDRMPPVELSGKQTVIKDAHLYDSLQAEYEGFISYDIASVNYNPVDAYSWGFEKSVKTESDYKGSGEVFPGTAYTYKLMYRQSDSAVSSGIVFYDLLEGGYFAESEDGQQWMESQWHGTFQGIDVQEAAQKLSGKSETVRCAPTVWYATKDRSLFTEADYDLSRTEIWSTAPPEDLSLMTAVAVDCSRSTDGTEFILTGREILNIYIHMRAPEEVQLDTVYTYNEGRVLARKGNVGEPTSLTSDAWVEVIAGEPDLHKESDPASGTPEKPAPLKQNEDLTYTLSVVNSGTVRTMTDIVVEDDIPDGLDIKASEVMVWFDNPKEKMKVSESPRISMTESGRHLEFLISSLSPGETAHIEIPCKVAISEGLLVNTAYVTSVNNVEKQVSSETTYHEVVSHSALRVDKTVKGSLGDKFYPFSFRLKFTGGETELPDTWNCRKGDLEFSVTPDEEGYLTFMLADGESIEFPEVPRGLHYEIEETDGTFMGYEVEAENSSGEIGEEDVQVSFVNTKNGAVPTGAWSGLRGCLILTLSVAAVLFLAIIRKRAREIE